MKKFNFINNAYFITICLFLFFGCAGDPNEKANTLYVEATQLMKKIIDDNSVDYKESYKITQQVLEKITSISTNYSSSSIAVELASGKTNISNFTVEEIVKLSSFFQSLIGSDNDFFPCAILLATHQDTVDSSTLFEILRGYLKANRLDEAIKITNFLKDGSDFPFDTKPDALAEIAVQAFKLKENDRSLNMLDDAIKIVTSIQKHNFKDSEIGNIAEAYASIGQISRAFEILQTMKKSVHKDSVFRAISIAQAKSGKLQEALTTIKKIEDDAIEKAALNKLVIELIKLGNSQEAYNLSKTNGNKFNESIYSAFVEHGKLEIANNILKSLNDNYEKFIATHILANSYLKNKHQKKAIQTLKEATKWVETISNSNKKFSGYITLVDSYLEMGEKELVLMLLNSSKNIVPSIKDTEKKSDAYAELAKRYAQIGDKTLAIELLNLSQKNALLLKSDDKAFERSMLLNRIAVYSINMVDFNQVVSFTKKADKLEWLKSSSNEQSGIYSSVAVSYAKMSNYTDALRMANLIKDLEDKGKTLIKIALEQAKNGAETESRATFKNALVLAQISQNPILLFNIDLAFIKTDLQINASEKKILHEIIDTAYPLSTITNPVTKDIDPGFVGDWDEVGCSNCYLKITKDGNTFFIKDIGASTRKYRAELKDGILVIGGSFGSSYIKLVNHDTLDVNGDIYKKMRNGSLR